MSDFDATYVSSIEEVLGNRDSIEYLKRFAIDIDNNVARKPVLIFGPTGTGKTITAHMLAKWRNWNIIEMSASDYRDSEAVERRLQVSANTRSLFGKRNMLLLDEIDELSGRFDKGAAASITRLVSDSKNPIIMTANNMWDQSISFLRAKTDHVEFRKLSALDISRVLANVSRKLNSGVSQKVIDMIAGKSAGDARSAINDLLVMAGSDEEMLEAIGVRDRKSDIFSVLDKIFSSNTVSAPLRAIANSDVDNDMMIKWIDENLPHRYTQPEDLDKGYESLSRATIFSSRASRKQYYTYWRYMNVFMSSGIALSKSSYPDTRRRYSFPKVISELSSSKADRASTTIIAKKMQRSVHQSIREIKATILPLMSIMMQRSISENGKEETYDFFESRFELTEKEVESIAAISPALAPSI
ncbi:MAG TPA: replication factor C large subunit [Candidatus Acidoferrum sp.]|nr:replication factor C large subunit [Candidatus Acidoferrum sp.]